MVFHTKGILLYLHANIRIDSLNLPGTNTLGYYVMVSKMANISYLTFGPWPDAIKLFMAVIYEYTSKLVFVSCKPLHPCLMFVGRLRPYLLGKHYSLLTTHYGRKKFNNIGPWA
jgi:hypothetical protein